MKLKSGKYNRAGHMCRLTQKNSAADSKRSPLRHWLKKFIRGNYSVNERNYSISIYLLSICLGCDLGRQTESIPFSYFAFMSAWVTSSPT